MEEEIAFLIGGSELALSLAAFLAGSGAGGSESSLSIFTARRTALRTGRLAMGSSSSISSSSSSSRGRS